MELNYVEFMAHIGQGNPSPGGLLLLRQSLRSIAPVPDNGSILEIGSNTGSSLVAIAEIFRSQKVVGIDKSTAMVEECQRYLDAMESEGWIGSNATIEIANAEQLPYPNSSFDLVVSGGTLSFIDDRAKAVGEIERVLKPGGTFLSLEYGYFDLLPPHSVSNAISEVLEFDVTELTQDYWYDLHTQGSLELEGITVAEPHLHRIKNPKSTVESVRKRLKRQGKEIPKKDFDRLVSYLNVFQENERFSRIFVFMGRKYEESEIVMDVAN